MKKLKPAKALPFRIDVNIHERDEHLTNPSSFAGLVVTRALAKTTVARLANLDLAGLQRSVNTALRASAEQLSGELTRHLGEAGGEAVGGALKKIFGNQ